MTRLMVVVVSFLAVAAFADEKKCAGLKDDGSVIAEASWENGKSTSCKAKVKEAVLALCTAETKTIKYQLRLSEGQKPMPSIVVCPGVLGKGPTKEQVACYGGCSDAQKACHAACDKADKDCNKKCLTTVTSCNAGCKASK